MKEEHIDLLVERLQGTFPTSKISPKAVIATWRKDTFLQDFPSELGLMLRERLQESCSDFPSLREVKFHAKKLMPKTHDAVCRHCDGLGYVPEMENGDFLYRPAYSKRSVGADGKPFILSWRRTPDSEPEPILYHFMNECVCRTGEDF